LALRNPENPKDGRKMAEDRQAEKQINGEGEEEGSREAGRQEEIIIRKTIR